MKRKFYNELIKWKEEGMQVPLMVLGARQVGKTYIINEFCKNEFKDYIYINLLERKEIIEIFKEPINFEKKVHKLELVLQEKLVNDSNDKIIFIDEIQESEEIISSLKAFAENDNKYNIIVAGSLLGVKINRFNSSFPVGKVKMLEMYPMDFEEFMLAIDKEMWIVEIKRCYDIMEEISIHEELLHLYRTYLCIGGLPESIKNFLNSNQDILLYDTNYLKNIVDSYVADMNKYVTSFLESVKIESIYKTIPIILGKENNKFQYSDVTSGAKKREYSSSIDWLIASNLVYKANLVKKVEVPLKAFMNEDAFKLYLNDVGILTSILEIEYNEILLDKEFMYKGAIVKNYVATHLRANGLTLYYWNSKNRAEVDFVIYNQDRIIPIEVKAGANTRSKSLNSYIEKYNPNYSIRLSTKNFGYENNIKSIPLYAAFLIK